MSKGEQLASLSPNASLRHVRALLQQGDSWTREVLLCVTRNTLTVKDGVTKVILLINIVCVVIIIFVAIIRVFIYDNLQVYTCFIVFLPCD